MNILLLSFKISDYKIIPKKLFRKEKIEEIYYTISLEYNIDEDRFYYRDDEKCIPTKKDLSRSILLIYDIYKRYEKFELKNHFSICENNLERFLRNFFNCNNNESDLYLKKMIFGTQPINLLLLNEVLEELNIDGVDFTKYYYYQYPMVKFR